MISTRRALLTGAICSVASFAQPVCEPAPSITAGSAIVVGFVGGFVRQDDTKHPEVRYSACLQKRYPSRVRTRVFTNRQGKEALNQILKWRADGENAEIILYGHSWGASQIVRLARELERRNIPVLLTIQVDSVHKPGHDDSVIPSNVRTAINFYQTRGPIHGRREIRAADPKRTNVLGNFRMSYDGRQIESDQCSWLARIISRPHCQIENDPRVWDRISSLVDSTLAEALQASAGPLGSSK